MAKQLMAGTTYLALKTFLQEDRTASRRRREEEERRPEKRKQHQQRTKTSKTDHLKE